MLLTGHSQNANLERCLPLLRRTKPPYWVALDPPAAAAATAAQTTRLIVRHFWRYDFSQDAVRADMGRPAADAAAEFVAACRTQDWFPHAWAAMTPPAMAVAASPPDLLAWAVDFQAACVALLRDAGKECFVANVPTGNDGYFVPGATYYACQEYGWPVVMAQAPFHALRYRTWFAPVLARNPAARLAVLECGATALLAEPAVQVEGAPHGADIGWRGGFGVAGCDPRGYLDSLLAYQTEAARDPYVLLLAIYQFGGNEDWGTFEHLDSDAVEWFAQAAAASPTPGRVSGPATEPQRPTAGTQASRPRRTLDQQNAIDVVAGWARALAEQADRLDALAATAGPTAPALTAAATRERSAAGELHDVARVLEQQFPV